MTLPESVRIYLATAPADMRKGFDGLRALVESKSLTLDAGQLAMLLEGKLLGRGSKRRRGQPLLTIADAAAHHEHPGGQLTCLVRRVALSRSAA